MPRSNHNHNSNNNTLTHGEQHLNHNIQVFYNWSLTWSFHRQPISYGRSPKPTKSSILFSWTTFESRSSTKELANMPSNSPPRYQLRYTICLQTFHQTRLLWLVLYVETSKNFSLTSSSSCYYFILQLDCHVWSSCFSYWLHWCIFLCINCTCVGHSNIILGLLVTL